MIIVSFVHSGFYNATAWVRFTIYYRSIFYWCVILIHPDANQSISLSLSLSAPVSRSLYHSPASRLNQSSPSIIIGLHNLSCYSQEHNADSNFNGATFIPVLL